jgi:aldose 1-epimerase
LNPEIILQCGIFSAGIVPLGGGSVSRFFSQNNDTVTNWMRPASAQDLTAGGSLGMACFPLLPFSNRIRDGRFVFQGKTVQLPLNFGDHPHAIHGHGWENPWQIQDQTDTSLSLGYNHPADEWPWTYSGQQIFTLDESSLTIEISLTNAGDSDMPAGLGLHPYFPRSAGVTIQANVEAMWQVDHEIMPVTRVKPQSPADPNVGLDVNEVALDNGYTGWQQSTQITWPDRDQSLHMTATGPLDHLVIFTPAGEDFFCVEPVSHSTDAVNTADDDSGLIVLPPGGTVSASVRFEIT